MTILSSSARSRGRSGKGWKRVPAICRGGWGMDRQVQGQVREGCVCPPSAGVWAGHGQAGPGASLLGPECSSPAPVVGPFPCCGHGTDTPAKEAEEGAPSAPPTPFPRRQCLLRTQRSERPLGCSRAPSSACLSGCPEPGLPPCGQPGNGSRYRRARCLGGRFPQER